MKIIYGTYNKLYLDILNILEIYGHELVNNVFKIMLQDHENCLDVDFIYFLHKRNSIDMFIHENDNKNVYIEIKSKFILFNSNKIDIDYFIRFIVGCNSKIIVSQSLHNIYCNYLEKHNIDFTLYHTDDMCTIGKDVIHRLSLLSQSKRHNYMNRFVKDKIYCNQDNIYADKVISVCDFFDSIGFKRILVENIINYNTIYKLLNNISIYASQYNIIKPFLSRDYMISNIYEGFIYDYNRYMKFKHLYEISEVFNLKDKCETVRIMIAIDTRFSIDYYIKQLLYIFDIPIRFYVDNNECVYIDHESKIKSIFQISNYHHHNYIECPVSLLLNMSNNQPMKDIFVCIQDINIIQNSLNYAIRDLLINDTSIIDYKVTDTYKLDERRKRFTFRVQKQEKS